MMWYYGIWFRETNKFFNRLVICVSDHIICNGAIELKVRGVIMRKTYFVELICDDFIGIKIGCVLCLSLIIGAC